MPRTVTLTFDDGTQHVYDNVPDNVTPAQVQERAAKEFAGKVLKNIDGGKKAESFLDKAIGAGEAALATGTAAVGGALGQLGGTIGGIAGMIAEGDLGDPAAVERAAQGASEAAAALTYQPRTAAGQRYAGNVGEVAQAAAPLAGMVPELNQLSQLGRLSAPAVRAAATDAALAAKPVVQNAAQAIQGVVSPASALADSAGAMRLPQEAVRLGKAENLPVPVTLTKGASSREPMQLAFEKEQIKGPQGAPLRQRAEENNLQVLQNFDTLIDQTGAQSPDLASTGSALTKSLSQGYKAAKNKTRVAFEKANKSPEAAQPVNQTALIEHLNSVPSGLPTTALTDHAKQYAKILGIAEDDGSGKLVARPANVKAMEDLRREISQNTGFDPSEKFQSVTMKNLIDSATEPVAGPLYKKARAERTAQARKYENRAIIARLVSKKRGMDDAQVPMDEVFKRTILNSSPEEITFLTRVLKTNGKAGENALTELRGETFKHIRDEATKGMGMDSADRPIISPAKLHNVVSQLDKNGRLDLVLGKKDAQIVRDLNDIARYVNTVPPGTLVNSSGTAGTILAALTEAGAAGAMTGVPIPVMSALRIAGKSIKDRRLQKRVNAAVANTK